MIARRDYLRYVTPKALPYLVMSVVVMVVWGCAAVSRLFTARTKPRFTHCLTLLIPMMALIIPLDAAPLSESVNTAAEYITQDMSSREEYELRCGFTEIDTAAREIWVSDERYQYWLFELFERPDAYTGYTIHMNAFVSPDPSCLPGEFVAARFAMICCAADITPIGILCEYRNQEGTVVPVPDGQWLTIHGHVTVRSQEDEYGDWTEPVIMVNDTADTDEVLGFLYI
jgi:putative membrane protein